MKQLKAPKEQVLPQAVEAEAGILGCALLKPSECMSIIIQRFPGPEVFFDLRHAKLYATLCAMHDARELIDVITLQQRLKDENLLEAVGGLGYLASLPDLVPSAANLDYYLEIVWDKFKLRKLIQGCTEIVGRCYDDEEQAILGLEALQRDLLHLCTITSKPVDWSVKEPIRATIKDLERELENKGAITGLPTGFPELDRKTCGLQSGDLIVFAGRPSMGKSSFVFNIADHLAVENRIPVGAFSLEMDKKRVMRRMISARSKVNLFKLGEDLIAEDQLQKVTQAAGRLAGAPLFIDDSRGLDDVQIRASLRRMVHEHGVKLGIIDYLGLLHTRRRIENRAQEIGEITGSLKTLAGELQIPIILCVQLNREYLKNQSQVPQISQLRESGNIEQDADLIGMLYSKAQEDDDRNTAKTNAGLYIGKQRHGPTGNINLAFHRAIFRFERPGIDDKDVPRETSLPHPND